MTLCDENTAHMGNVFDLLLLTPNFAFFLPQNLMKKGVFNPLYGKFNILTIFCSFTSFVVFPKVL